MRQTGKVSRIIIKTTGLLSVVALLIPGAALQASQDDKPTNPNMCRKALQSASYLTRSQQNLLLSFYSSPAVVVQLKDLKWIKRAMTAARLQVTGGNRPGDRIISRFVDMGPQESQLIARIDFGLSHNRAITMIPSELRLITERLLDTAPGTVLSSDSPLTVASATEELPMVSGVFTTSVPANDVTPAEISTHRFDRTPTVMGLGDLSQKHVDYFLIQIRELQNYISIAQRINSTLMVHSDYYYVINFLARRFIKAYGMPQTSFSISDIQNMTSAHAFAQTDEQRNLLTNLMNADVIPRVSVRMTGTEITAFAHYLERLLKHGRAYY